MTRGPNRKEPAVKRFWVNRTGLVEEISTEYTEEGGVDFAEYELEIEFDETGKARPVLRKP